MKVEPAIVNGYFKTLEVRGITGEVIPEYFCTTDAVVITLKGKATVFLKGQEVELSQKSCFQVPATVKHKLCTVEDFEALVVIGKEAELLFS